MSVYQNPLDLLDHLVIVVTVAQLVALGHFCVEFIDVFHNLHSLDGIDNFVSPVSSIMLFNYKLKLKNHV